ncbi:segregation and condensation protein B [Embleya hyalina]|uniref:Segregation and condensation protein B n=2 Tax=Embleya hyalina TaxID=516124 RepID=A0A401Z0R6_9ACTN|nr:segregation and condensation protein B [Embleya hyalina]
MNDDGYRREPGAEPEAAPGHEPPPAPVEAAVPAPRAARAKTPPPTLPVSDSPLPAALEAVLMVVQEPVSEHVLAEVLGHPLPEVVATLRTLALEYTAQGRGFDLREVAGGWRFYSRPEHAAAVERFVLDGQQSRLTQAALETLAVVAYRQPVSRGRIAAVRGVNCDGVMRTLLARGLVEEYGVEYETQATLYRTTEYFLERMGLRSLDELPELAPFLPEIEALEAEGGASPELLPTRAAYPLARSGDTGRDTGAVHTDPDDGETTTED